MSYCSVRCIYICVCVVCVYMCVHRACMCMYAHSHSLGAKKRPVEKERYLDKAEYGQVPLYLQNMKSKIEEEKVGTP